MTVPNIFGSATSAIPLSQLDQNFATAITLGNTAVYLGNTTTSLGNVTLTNVTISSGNVTLTGANVSGTANVSTLVVTGNAVVSVTDNTNAALRITQLGTGNALLVEDSTNPDSTPFVIDKDGAVIAGYTATVATVNYSAFGITPLIQFQGNSASTSSAGLYNWSNSSSSSSTLAFSKSISNVVGTRGALTATGTDLGNITFSGDDGTNFVAAASILAEVDGTPGTNDMPGRLVFSTTADGGSTPTERMRIDSAGRTVLTADNNGISGAAPINTLRFNDSDTTSSPAQPTGRVEFFVNDGSAGGTGVGSFIEGRAAGASGGGYIVIGTSASGATGATDVLTISVTGGITIARDAVTSPVSNDGNVFSGTYTPTLTNTTNVAASTAYECQYMRVGNVVTVSGQVDIDPTSAATDTVLGMTLPIASALAANRQLGGTAANSTAGRYGEGVAITADLTNDRAQFLLRPTSTNNSSYGFSFTYQVL